MHAKQQPQNSLNQLGCLYFVMAAWVSQGLRHFKSNAVVVLKAVLEVCARGESAVFLLLKRVRRFVFLLLLFLIMRQEFPQRICFLYPCRTAIEMWCLAQKKPIKNVLVLSALPRQDLRSALY